MSCTHPFDNIEKPNYVLYYQPGDEILLMTVLFVEFCMPQICTNGTVFQVNTQHTTQTVEYINIVERINIVKHLNIWQLRPY